MAWLIDVIYCHLPQLERHHSLTTGTLQRSVGLAWAAIPTVQRGWMCVCMHASLCVCVCLCVCECVTQKRLKITRRELIRCTWRGAQGRQ